MTWSNTWLLPFNTEKCTTVHIGKRFSSTYDLYEGNDTIDLSATHCERDLGVHVQDNLKWSDQCGKAAAKASSTLGLIRRHFKHLDTESFLILYKTYVRPHLEYCIQLWCPTLVKDIDCLEQIQRRATKLVQDLSYSERLEKLRLTTLKTRRLRGDLIETYKIITRKECIDPQHLFTFANPPYGLRGHSLKLYNLLLELDSTYRRTSFVKELSITGTSCLSTLWTLHRPIHSRTDWTSTGASRIWAFKVWLLSPLFYKYKYK